MKVCILVTLYTFDPVSFGFTLQLREHTKEIYLTYILYMQLFVDGHVSDVGVLLVQQVAFYFPTDSL